MTRNESERARGTHVLESTSGRTSEDTTRSKRTRCTHILERAPGGSSEDTKRKQKSEEHSLSGEHIRRDN